MLTSCARWLVVEAEKVASRVDLPLCFGALEPVFPCDHCLPNSLVDLLDTDDREKEDEDEDVLDFDDFGEW